MRRSVETFDFSNMEGNKQEDFPLTTLKHCGREVCNGRIACCWKSNLICSEQGARNSFHKFLNIYYHKVQKVSR